MWPTQLPFLRFGVCRVFLSSSSLCNTSSFFTRSVQLILSTLEIFALLGFYAAQIGSWLLRFGTTYRSDLQRSNSPSTTPYKAMFIMQRFTSLFLKFKSNLLIKRVSTLREIGYDAEKRFSWLKVRSSDDVYEHDIETVYSINAGNFFLMIFIIRIQ